jgi:hypothetical protein
MAPRLAQMTQARHPKMPRKPPTSRSVDSSTGKMGENGGGGNGVSSEWHFQLFGVPWGALGMDGERPQAFPGCFVAPLLD